MKPWPRALAIASAVVAASLYLAGLPVIDAIPGWFYHPVDKTLHATPIAIAALIAGGGLAAIAVRLTSGGRPTGAVFFVAAGIAAQLGLSGLGGMDEIWARHADGHGEFWRPATERVERPLETLRSYEELAQAGTLSNFGASKPPGSFAVYMGVAALGQVPAVRDAQALLIASAEKAPRLEGYAPAAATSFWLFPLCTALLLPLVAGLARELAGRPELGAAAALWTLTTPAFLLVTYHLDGAIYPLFAVASAWAAARGGRTGRARWMGVAGGLASLGLYFSFSLLAALPLVGGSWVAAWRTGQSAPPDDPSRPAHPQWAFTQLGAAGLAGLAAFAAVQLVLAWLLAFDLATRLEVALAYHAAWKRGVPTLLWRFVAPLEWALYVGLPLVSVWLYRAGVGMKTALERRTHTTWEPSPLGSLLSLGLAGLVVALAATAGTNEVARLWLFLVPFVGAAVAVDLPAIGTTGRGTPALAWLAGLQALVAVVMKGTQPW
jgi:hypothetical protein